MSRYLKASLRRAGFEEPTVNLTPLIDVVFVILIMFILIAPILELEQIELASAPSIAEKERVAAQENSPISIQVHANNSVWLNKQLVKLEELGSLLRQARLAYPHARVQLYQDKKAHFGTYQEVKNTVEEAGFQEMDILLKPGL
jgi:biopolymer transport protein ExbD